MPRAVAFDRATSLVARNLGTTAVDLQGAFRAATADDIDGVLRLRERVFGQTPAWNDREYLAWRYGLQHGRRSHATFYILTLQGDVVAGIGAEEFQLQTPGGPVAAACPMDILCVRSHWETGVGVWLNLALFERYPVVLALGSNEHSGGLIRGLYEPLAPREEFKFPLNLNALVRSRVNVPVVSHGVALAVESLSRVRAWRLSRHAGGLDVHAIDRFPEVPAASSDPASPGHVISLARTADYLNWRFVENPRAAYHILGGFRDGRLAGYAVYSIVPGSAGRSVVRLADWWSEESSDRGSTLPALFAAVTDEARRLGSAYVQANAMGRHISGALQGTGFLRRAPIDVQSGIRRRTPETFPWLDRDVDWSLTGLGDDAD